MFTNLLPLLLGAATVYYAAAYPAMLSEDTSASLEARQDSCMSWTQAPNTTVCCDHSTGQWKLTEIQTDYFPASGPECPPEQVATVAPDGSTIYSDVQESPTPGSPVISLPGSGMQQNYCNPGMQPPNNTLCCDMSNGQWKETTGVIYDGVHTGSSECPALDSGTINVGRLKS